MGLLIREGFGRLKVELVADATKLLRRITREIEEESIENTII
jgi:hypothetical protein